MRGINSFEYLSFQHQVKNCFSTYFMQTNKNFILLHIKNYKNEIITLHIKHSINSI
jgi:hypothetical protein